MRNRDSWVGERNVPNISKQERFKRALRKCRGEWATAFWISKVSGDLYIRDVHANLKPLVDRGVVLKRKDRAHNLPTEYKVVGKLD